MDQYGSNKAMIYELRTGRGRVGGRMITFGARSRLNMVRAASKRSGHCLYHSEMVAQVSVCLFTMHKHCLHCPQRVDLFPDACAGPGID